MSGKLKIRTLRLRMLLLVLPVVVIGLAALAVLSITRATSNEKKAAYTSLTNRTQSLASQWGGTVDVKLQLAETAAATLPAALASGHTATINLLTSELKSDPTAQLLAADVQQPSPKDDDPGVLAINGAPVPYPQAWSSAKADADPIIADP